jgi:hypothetical protein
LCLSLQALCCSLSNSSQHEVLSYPLLLPDNPWEKNFQLSMRAVYSCASPCTACIGEHPAVLHRLDANLGMFTRQCCGVYHNFSVITITKEKLTCTGSMSLCDSNARTVSRSVWPNA